MTEIEIVKLLTKAYENNLPEWQKSYMKKICTGLQVHTKGLLFSKVDTLFPNEHPDSKAHCINTYEPITKGSIWKAIINIGRIFSNSSFTVSASDTILEYINGDTFEGENLFTSFLTKWIDNAIATDPNAYCAIYPEEYEGPRVKFIKSQHIKYIDNDMVVFVSEDDSEKRYSVEDQIIKSHVFYDPMIKNINSKKIVEKTYNQQVNIEIIKAVYHVFTKDALITFTTDGKKYDWELYEFKKTLEQIPAFKIKSPSLVHGINESFVASFIPFGNLALLQHRNHRAVDLMFSYPRMSEIMTPCDNEACEMGLCSDTEGNQTTCGRCGGSQFVTVQSPYKVYQKRIDTGLSDPEVIKNLLQSSPVDFHTPDATILEYSKDSWKGYLAMAEEAVFVQQKQLTGNVESAKKAEIDKEGEYTWVLSIYKAFNNDLTKVIQSLQDYTGTSSTVSIEQPTSLAIVTETEAFEAMNIIFNSDAPVFVKAQKIENFVHKFVSKSSPIIKAIRILKALDPLLFYSQRDIQTFKSNNVVTPESWIVHVFAYPILMQLYSQDKELFEKDDQQIIDEIKALIPAPESDIKGELLKAAQ